MSPIVDAVHAGTLPALGDELLHGLKEVHVEASELIDARELSIGRAASR